MTAQHPENHVAGRIPKAELEGGIDLYLTLASGQTYRWRCADGDLFTPPDTFPTPWYETVHRGSVIRVRERADALEFEGTGAAKRHLQSLLRLDDDLEAILEAGPERPVYREAVSAHEGMRLVVDSLYVGLITFICSTNVHVRRIHQMIQSLQAEFGPTVTFADRTIHGFPRAETLAAADEAALRECGLGYRAPYVRETAAAIAGGDPPLEAIDGEYEARRESLTAYHGVGPKVADCALLFGAGDLEPVPLDRWINRAIERHFPECAHDSYAETSRAIRAALGPYPGYAQTYLFHHLRTASS